ncbi:MAG: Calx-beta domain-containing protein [Pirellulales bacterium]
MRFFRRRRETTIRRNWGPRGRLRPPRAKTLEVLERREMLAAAPWQNPLNSRDVNFDQRVSAIDVLVVVNDLLAHGSHALEREVAPLAATPGANRVYYLDVSGDNRVSAIDVLMVVNELLDTELMLVQTFPTDLNDNPITSIAVGEQYKLRTMVQDIRVEVVPFPGVIAVGVEITLDSPPNLSSFPGQTLQYNPFFGFTESTVLTDRVIGHGIHTGIDFPGNAPQFFFSALVTATNPGTLTILPGIDPDPNHDNGLFGEIEPVILTEDQIRYEGSMLTITGPSISIGDVTQLEDAGTPFNFEVRLSAPLSAQTVTASFRTIDGSGPNGATAPSDYMAITTGTLTFAPMQTLLTIPITVNSDMLIEPNETFSVELFDLSTNIVPGRLTGEGIIVNEDSPPALSISDASATAGLTESEAVFTVTLSGSITEEVTVGFATQDDTALDGIDYESRTGNLSFMPGGPMSKEIHVTILPSSTPRPDRTFFVTLSSQMPPDIILADDRGIGTIVTQGLAISDATVVERNFGTTPAVFTVSLSGTPQEEVTVFYTTQDGSGPNGAMAPGDYTTTTGTLTFMPLGSPTQTITVPVQGDMDPEGNEQFFVDLSDAVGAPIFSSRGVGTILNDDGDKVLYRLELTDEFEVPLSMDEVIDVDKEFFLRVFVQDVQTVADGVAQAFLDVMYQSSLVTPVGNPTFGPFYTTIPFFRFGDGLLDDFGAFGQAPPPPGFDRSAERLLFKQQFRTIDVGQVNFVGSVLEDDLDPGRETLLYDPAPEEPVPSEQINVLDTTLNIGRNVITVNDVTGPESGNLVFTVTRFLPDETTATVFYTTQDDTATQGEDYVRRTGTLTFVPGVSDSHMITITLIDDPTDEPDETFFLVLSNEMNASISELPGTGTIEDNDGPVSVSAHDASGSEGTNLLFTVSLSAASGKQVTVSYATADSTSGIMATADVDYTPTSGVLTFAPGVVQQLVTVEALADIEFEPNETFRLVLGDDPENANLGTAEGVGTIIDVPPAGISGFVYVDLNNNGIKEGNETGIPGAIVTATRRSDGVSESIMTGDDGSYFFASLFPDTYTVSETQPGFFNDGRDARFGVESPVNDRFTGVVLAPSASEAGFNFGELGVRGEFVAAFINRRALFATSAVPGFFPTLNMPGTTLNLGTGEIWVSFDGGWDGLRMIEALFNSAQGSATMRLYNSSLQEIALSGPTPTGAVLLYNGHTGPPYFLRISGSNRSVIVEMSDVALPGTLSAPTGGDGENLDPPANPPNSQALSTVSRFASAQPMTAPEIEPLVASDASDEALAEGDDWILETLLA